MNLGRQDEKEDIGGEKEDIGGVKGWEIMV